MASTSEKNGTKPITVSTTKTSIDIGKSLAEKANDIKNAGNDSGNNSSYVGYGPFKFDAKKESSYDSINTKNKAPITYSIPYTENKTNITKGDISILKPDDKGKFGYVVYEEEQYPIHYNEFEEGKQYFCPIWKETYHFQLPKSGLNFDLVAAITDTSPEELQRRTLTTSDGKILLQKDSKNTKFNNDTLDISNHTAKSVYSYVGLNILNFAQNGLERNNYDVILMRDGSNNPAAVITYTQDYLAQNPYGIKEKRSTSAELLAINEEGKLYNINGQ